MVGSSVFIDPFIGMTPIEIAKRVNWTVSSSCELPNVSPFAPASKQAFLGATLVHRSY